MDQLRDYADDRLVSGCVYCGGSNDTCDHVPSRIFLDAPVPENLPVVGACRACNNSFSLDEEYLACLIESVLAGSTDPDRIRRPGIANILRRKPALRARIDTAQKSVDGQLQFRTELVRVRNVLLKLARGHAAFELSQVCRYEPIVFWSRPLHLLTNEERDLFDSCHVVQLFGEIGSRSQQRILVSEVKLRSENGEESIVQLLINDWINVQDGRYRYLATHDTDGVKVKIVIAEYLACEVVWGV